MHRKIEASNDVWAEFIGAICTREKFDADKLEAAKRKK